MFISIILFCITVPIGLLWGLIFRFTHISSYLFRVAITIDMLGNVLGAGFLDFLFLKKHPIYKFGKIDETISKVLGMNQWSNHLSTFGKCLVWILDKIEDDHCLKACNKFPLHKHPYPKKNKNNRF